MSSAGREPADPRGAAPSSSEALHARAGRLHELSAGALLDIFEADDAELCGALRAARPAIERLAEAMRVALAGGGRILYLGAGTSGRLGALDAAEWGPTFGVGPERIRAVVAGGERALREAVEGAEDRGDEARSALAALELAPRDLLVSLSASGRTPFVVAGLDWARERSVPRALITAQTGALPAALSADSALVLVTLDTGPELLAGSTRLKAAAATHMVLQRASNLCAVASGWVYAGRMVEMRATNDKLRVRAAGIVADLARVDHDRAQRLLEQCAWDIKVALVAARYGVTPDESRARLARVGRDLRALEGFAC